MDEGLVRDIGVSNFSRNKVEEILKGARRKPTVLQVGGGEGLGGWGGGGGWRGQGGN